jgi:hypothetical protein
MGMNGRSVIVYHLCVKRSSTLWKEITHSKARGRKKIIGPLMYGWSPHPGLTPRGHIKESQRNSATSKDLFSSAGNRVKPYFWE